MLTEEFRLDYCNLWQSLIWTDMEKVKKYCHRLGAGDFYPLLACMLTARSWNSVNRGISQAPVTATEVGVPSWPCPLLHTRIRTRMAFGPLPIQGLKFCLLAVKVERVNRIGDTLDKEREEEE